MYSDPSCVVSCHASSKRAKLSPWGKPLNVQETVAQGQRNTPSCGGPSINVCARFPGTMPSRIVANVAGCAWSKAIAIDATVSAKAGRTLELEVMRNVKLRTIRRRRAAAVLITLFKKCTRARPRYCIVCKFWLNGVTSMARAHHQEETY